METIKVEPKSEIGKQQLSSPPSPDYPLLPAKTLTGKIQQASDPDREHILKLFQQIQGNPGVDIGQHLLPPPPTYPLLEAITLTQMIRKIQDRYPKFVQQLMEAGVNLGHPEYRHILEVLEQMMEAGIDFHVYSWKKDYNTEELTEIRKRLDNGYRMHQEQTSESYTNFFWPQESNLTIFHLKIGSARLVIGYAIETPAELASVFRDPTTVFKDQNGNPEEEIVWITALLAMTSEGTETKYGLTNLNLRLFNISFYLMYLHYSKCSTNSHNNRNAWIMMRKDLLTMVARMLTPENFRIVQLKVDMLRSFNDTDKNAVTLLPEYFYKGGIEGNEYLKVGLGCVILYSPKIRDTLQSIAQSALAALKES